MRLFAFLASLVLAVSASAQTEMGFNLSIGYPKDFIIGGSDECVDALGLYGDREDSFGEFALNLEALFGAGYLEDQDGGDMGYWYDDSLTFFTYDNLIIFSSGHDYNRERGTWMPAFLTAQLGPSGNSHSFRTRCLTQAYVPAACEEGNLFEFRLVYYFDMDDMGDCDQDLAIEYYCTAEWDENAIWYDPADPDDFTSLVLEWRDCDWAEAFRVKEEDLSSTLLGSYVLQTPTKDDPRISRASEDSDADGVWDDTDNCVIRNVEQNNDDADDYGNVCDNCTTVTNADQDDVDDDLVGDLCDNCDEVANPVRGYVAGRTTTGYQLDDDGDGYGNQCDGDLDNSTPALVTAIDTIYFKTCIGELVGATTCGSGTQNCDICDIDGISPAITAVDTIHYKALIGEFAGPKCSACPLACDGDDCP